MSTFSLRIVTPERDVFSGTVDYVSVETSDGRAGFLRGALPRVAVLKEGVIEVTVGNEKMGFYAADGVYSIINGGMIVATSDCYDMSKDSGDAAVDKRADREFDYAKAKIASAMLKIKGKKSAD